MTFRAFVSCAGPRVDPHPDREPMSPGFGLMLWLFVPAESLFPGLLDALMTITMQI